MTLKDQRLELETLLGDNPSLRPILSEAIAQAWPRAIVGAERETTLDPAVFPASCPWSPSEVLDVDFLPT